MNVKVGSVSETFEYSNGLRYAPRTVLVYYIDNPKKEKITQSNIESFLKSSKFQRPAEDIKQETNQLFQDMIAEVQQREEKKVKDGNSASKNNDVNPWKIDSKTVSGSVSISFVNLGSDRMSSLKILDLNLAEHQVSILVYDSTDVNVITFLEHPDSNCWMFHNVYNDFYDYSNCVNFFNYFENPPVVKGQVKDKIYPSSNWIKLTRAYFMFYSETNNLMNMKFTFKDDAFLFLLNEDNNTPQISHDVTPEHFRLQFYGKGYKIIDYEIPKFSWLKKFRLNFLSGKKSSNYYEGSTAKKGSYDLISDNQINTYNQNINLKGHVAQVVKTKDSIDINMSFYSNPIDLLFIGVTQSEEKTRIIFYQLIKNKQRDKFRLNIKNENLKPIEIYYLDSRTESIVKLEYERRFLFNENLFRPHHFYDYLSSTEMLGKSQINRKVVTGEDKIGDLGEVTQGGDQLSEFKDIEILQYETETHIQVILYFRDKGIFLEVREDQFILKSYEERIDSNTDKKIMFPRKMRFLSSLKVALNVFDIGNNFKQFPMGMIEIFPGKLYFSKFDKSFQEQLRNDKIEICELTNSLLKICVFAGKNQLELDLTGDGLIVSQHYFSRTLPFRQPGSFGYDIQVASIDKNNRCRLLQKSQFTGFQSNEVSKKWFVEITIGTYSVEKAMFFSLAESKVNVLLLMDPLAGVISEDELKTFNLKGGGCSVTVAGKILTLLKNGKLEFEETVTKQKAVFKMISPFELVKDKKIVTFTSINSGFTEQLDRMGVKEQYYHATDRERIFKQLFFNRNFFTMPAVLFTSDEEEGFQTFSHHYKLGQIEVHLKRSSLTFETDETLIGESVFSDRRINTRSLTFSKIIVKIFLNGLNPTEIVFKLKTPFDVKKAYKDRIDFDHQTFLEANVHSLNLYFLSTEIKGQNFMAYYVENRQGNLEVLIYKDNELQIYDATQKYIFPMGNDLTEAANAPDNESSKKKCICALKNVNLSNENQIAFATDQSAVYKVQSNISGYPWAFVVNKEVTGKPRQIPRTLLTCAIRYAKDEDPSFDYLADIKEKYSRDITGDRRIRV